jgi:hypothetical protein
MLEETPHLAHLQQLMGEGEALVQQVVVEEGI